MTEVTYVGASGATTALDLPDGISVMEGAVENDVDGIVAECGGNAMCATCHVYVPEEWLVQLPAASEAENATLESAISERKPNSRLSCQIQLTDALNGLVVQLPKSQL